MKRITMAVLAFGLLATVAAPNAADAGLFSRDRNKRLSSMRTDMPEEMKEPKRFDLLPRMSFHLGTLSRGGAGWELGGVNLRLAKDCTIIEGGAMGGSLVEGNRAVVMGPRFGQTLIAWQVRVIDDAGFRSSYEEGVTVESSGSDPSVGRIVSAPE